MAKASFSSGFCKLGSEDFGEGSALCSRWEGLNCNFDSGFPIGVFLDSHSIMKEELAVGGP